MARNQLFRAGAANKLANVDPLRRICEDLGVNIGARARRLLIRERKTRRQIGETLAKPNNNYA
eukprot:3525197-Lingulodinium_polyedra.AAC.1